MAVVEISNLREGVATVMMQGGRANALGDAFCATLHDVLVQLRDDASIRGVVLTGSGRFFSAGRDLREADEQGAARRANNSFDAAMRTAFSFPKPMVAAVNGHAIAGGLVLALTADWVVLADGDYKLGLTELDIGLPFPRSAFEILGASLSPRVITRLAYGADLIGPHEGFQLGVGNEIVPAAELVGCAAAWIRPVAERPLPPFALCKRWLRAAAMARIEGQSEEERHALAEAGGSAETRARLAAYAERLRGPRERDST